MAASSTPDLSRLKLSQGWNPSRKVRIVGKIRGFTGQELGLLSHSKPWITVNKPPEDDPSGKVTILFGEKGTSRKDTFELDYCYDQGDDDSVLFSRELKSAISDVFTGRDASVIAYGARGSGKTYTIQGLATSAIRDILSRADDAGKSVSISFFEVFQERAYDLLDPEQNEVQVLEDFHGKVKLKGLSQVSIKSISEFQDIYFGRGTSCKQAQKTPVGLLRRSHRGLIVHVSSPDENQNDRPIGVINFVDLAGYEDARSSNRDGTTLAESTRINKSLHSIMNVVFALNTNDSHVPYRENKLTRMLRESLGGSNFTLMLACMNPVFCQDTIHAVSLASRSCENIKMAFHNSTTKCKSSTKRDVRTLTTPSSVKKQNSSGARDFSIKKTTGVLKGRKLFSGGKVTTSKQAEAPSDKSLASKSKLLQDTASIVASSLQEEEELPPNDSIVTKSELHQDDTLFSTISSSHEEAEVSSETFQAADPVSMIKTSGLGGGTEKGDKAFNTNKDRSPLLSERLRALTNNLKELQASTPLAIKLPDEGSQAVVLYPVEPRTPVVENDFGASDMSHMTMVKYNSPWEAFSERNSRVKDSFAQECIKFLNSASKDDLKRLKGIGERRAEAILELRDDSPEHFKTLEDLQEIGLSEKQVKSMVKTMAAELFN